MPFVSKAHREGLDPKKAALLNLGYLPLGTHPDTRDTFLLSHKDRFSGTYVVGVQGVGKSALLANLIVKDATLGQAVIVIDPHGDLVMQCLATLPQNLLHKVFVLDMEDEAYPFGVNLTGRHETLSSMALAQSIDRVMHIFEVVWPEVLRQQNLPRYLRAAVIALLANPGTTLIDLHRFLLDDTVRAAMLARVTDPTVRDFWRIQYDELAYSERVRRVQPLLGRLELLFMGRSIVRNIVGQSETSIDFPVAIEQKELIFIKLPTRSLTQDARLIGTMLTAQIHAAVFSFANRPANERPGVSLYIDEFQNFVTPDIAELFTEGRKFGVKLTVAHQYRSQLPDYLQASTMTARTKICFQLTPEDGHELAHLFSGGEGEVRPEDIDPHPTAHLLAYGSDNQHAKDLTEWYLRPLLSQKSGQHVEIAVPRNPLDVGIQTNVLGVLTSPNPLHWFSPKEPAPNPVVADPTTYLDALLYNVMTTGNPTLPIPAPIVYGFSNCGTGFYRQLQLSLNKGWLLSSAVTYPEALVVEEPDGSQRWTRRPENGGEQLYHFIFLLRMTMKHLAKEPIGKRSELSHADLASMLTKLSRRAAFVNSSTDVGVMYTNNLPKPLTGDAFAERLKAIYHQTHERYCRPKEEVERALFGNPRNQETLTTPTEEPDTPLRRWEEL